MPGTAPTLDDPTAASDIRRQPRPRPDGRRLLLLAAAAFAAFLLLYLLAVQTEIGQRADQAALTGSSSLPDRAQGTADELLRVVSVGSLLAATAVLSALAWMRRRPGLLVIPAAVIGISVVAAELFKLVILTRPELTDNLFLVENSYPSGHTTVATSIGLAALLIAPSQWRPRVAVGAFVLAAAAGVFVVTADWHRPSDPLGAYLLTLAVAAATMAWIRRRAPSVVTGEHPTIERRGSPVRRRQPPAVPSQSLRLELIALLSGAGLFVGSLVIASLRYGAQVDWNRFHAAFLLSSAVTVIVAGLVVAALLRALEDEPAPAAKAPERTLG